MNKESLFYQIPSNKRGVILAVVAAVLAAVSIVWGSYMIWDNDPDVVNPTPVPSITPSPLPSATPKAPQITPPKTPAQQPGTTIIQTPGKTVIVPVPVTPAPAPPPVVVPVPVPATPEAPSCLDLRHVLAPGCKIL